MALPVEKWLTSIVFRPLIIVNMQVMPIAMTWINLQFKKMLRVDQKNLKFEMNLFFYQSERLRRSNYSFNPMLKSQFLCFGVFGQSLPDLTKFQILLFMRKRTIICKMKNKEQKTRKIKNRRQTQLFI